MEGRTNSWTIAVITIIAVLLPGVPQARPESSAQKQTPSVSDCSLKILLPQPGDKVGQSMTVKGTAKIPEDGFLWVLAKKKSMGDLWWPQPGGPIGIENGEWEAEVFFGRPSDVGSTFEIAAVVVTSQTNQALRKWFSTAQQLDYPPIQFPNSYQCPVVTVKVEKSS